MSRNLQIPPCVSASLAKFDLNSLLQDSVSHGTESTAAINLRFTTLLIQRLLGSDHETIDRRRWLDSLVAVLVEKASKAHRGIPVQMQVDDDGNVSFDGTPARVDVSSQEVGSVSTTQGAHFRENDTGYSTQGPTVSPSDHGVGVPQDQLLVRLPIVRSSSKTPGRSSSHRYPCADSTKKQENVGLKSMLDCQDRSDRSTRHSDSIQESFKQPDMERKIDNSIANSQARESRLNSKTNARYWDVNNSDDTPGAVRKLRRLSKEDSYTAHDRSNTSNERQTQVKSVRDSSSMPIRGTPENFPISENASAAPLITDTTTLDRMYIEYLKRVSYDHPDDKDATLRASTDFVELTTFFSHHVFGRSGVERFRRSLLYCQTLRRGSVRSILALPDEQSTGDECLQCCMQVCRNFVPACIPDARFTQVKNLADVGRYIGAVRDALLRPSNIRKRFDEFSGGLQQDQTMQTDEESIFWRFISDVSFPFSQLARLRVEATINKIRQEFPTGIRLDVLRNGFGVSILAFLPPELLTLYVRFANLSRDRYITRKLIIDRITYSFDKFEIIHVGYFIDLLKKYLPNIQEACNLAFGALFRDQTVSQRLSNSSTSAHRGLNTQDLLSQKVRKIIETTAAHRLPDMTESSEGYDDDDYEDEDGEDMGDDEEGGEGESEDERPEVSSDIMEEYPKLYS